MQPIEYVPSLVTAAVVLACVALPLAVGAVLRGGARIAVTAGLFAWLAVTTLVASSGLYTTDPWLGVGVVVPLALGLLALRLPSITHQLTEPHAAAALVAIQILRLIGGAFLALLAIDQLPPGFALPAGIGDVLVGVLAPFVAYALRRRPDRRGLGIGFSVLGILDLVVAIPTGLVHAPGRLQLIVTDPTTGILGELPMSLVPTFVVPVALVLHIATLRALRARRSAPGERRVAHRMQLP